MPEETSSPSSSSPSLRDTISAAVASTEAAAPAPVTEAPSGAKTPAPTESPTATPRAEGASSPTPSTESYLKDKDADKPPEAPKAAEAPKPDATPQEQARARVDRPPQSWKGEARTAWGTLPLPVRQEVLKRERDIDNQLKQYAGLRSFTNEFANVVQPFLPRIQSLQSNPILHTKRLFEIESGLASGTKSERAQLLANIIRDYDIDLPTLDEVLSGRITADTEPASVMRREIQQALGPVYQFMGQMQQGRQQAETAQQTQANEMVVNMADDPKYPYFEELRHDMADLIDLYAKRGLAIGLQEAYTKAAAGHPEIGPLVIGQAQRTHVQDQTAKAKAASVSVGGAPRMAPPQGVDTSDLRATLEHAIAMHARR